MCVCVCLQSADIYYHFQWQMQITKLDELPRRHASDEKRGQTLLDSVKLKPVFLCFFSFEFEIKMIEKWAEDFDLVIVFFH